MSSPADRIDRFARSSFAPWYDARISFAAAFAITLLAADSTQAVPVVGDAIFESYLELTGVDRTISQVGLTGPGSITHVLPPGSDGSFTGTATIRVTDTGGSAPVTSAESEATFSDLLIDGTAEGFARIDTRIYLEFTLDPADGAPSNIPVPILFDTSATVSVWGNGSMTNLVDAHARIEVRGYRGTDRIFFDDLSLSVTCGQVAGVCPNEAAAVTISQTTVLSGMMIPDTDIGQIRQFTTGLTGHGTNSPTTGGYYAFVDPNIRIDPDFLVEIDGEFIPGDQLYSISVSPNVIPEPGTAGLLAIGLAMLAHRARSRGGLRARS